MISRCCKGHRGWQSLHRGALNQVGGESQELIFTVQHALRAAKRSQRTKLATFTWKILFSNVYDSR